MNDCSLSSSSGLSPKTLPYERKGLQSAPIRKDFLTKSFERVWDESACATWIRSIYIRLAFLGGIIGLHCPEAMSVLSSRETGQVIRRNMVIICHSFDLLNRPPKHFITCEMRKKSVPCGDLQRTECVWCFSFTHTRQHYSSDSKTRSCRYRFREGFGNIPLNS